MPEFGEAGMLSRIAPAGIYERRRQDEIPWVRKAYTPPTRYKQTSTANHPVLYAHCQKPQTTATVHSHLHVKSARKSICLCARPWRPIFRISRHGRAKQKIEVVGSVSTSYARAWLSVFRTSSHACAGQFGDRHPSIKSNRGNNHLCARCMASGLYRPLATQRDG